MGKFGNKRTTSYRLQVALCMYVVTVTMLSLAHTEPPVASKGVVTRKWLWPDLKYYPSICLWALKKTREISLNIAGVRIKRFEPVTS